ncbi:serine racemase isoform X1 [Bufo gargarizans]|uniref:serine racemase isoform X1 n=1 Tax=Bufo gargarizans TaxID=30331 RepID=UPI001CF28B06|nr:serine racemase isoform X1 [Bufo gargarizans]XP_044139833.1 serine racemase isoform X1 [Bufo gargarizans]
MGPPYCITLRAVQEAQRRIQGLVHTTPVMTCSSLDALSGRKLFFKCELLQKTGSFKIRGALNAVKSLPSDKCTAVVTHSSGNHGQALALAAQSMGIPAHVVVPTTAAACKKAAILRFGALIVDCEPTDKSRAEVAAKTLEKTGGVLIHPNQDPAVIAGQGTIGLEILEQVPGLEALVVPVGGGGMVAGIAVAVKAIKPDVKIYAAEPLNADDCYRSKKSGVLTPNLQPPITIADGVKSSIGPNTWPIIRDLVDDVFTVTEDEIKSATRLVWERMKLLIEPTAGLGLAVILSSQFQEIGRDVQNIGVVLCGGNVDLATLH